VTALAGATAGALGWWLVGAAIGVAGAVAALTMSVIALGAIRQRTINRRRAATQRAIRLVIAELAAGSRPAEALKAGADALAELPDPAVADALRAAAAAAATGSEVDRALRADPELGALAGAWRVASTVGAPLVDVLSRTADDLAARAAQDRAVAAALAGPRSSAMVVAVLPVLGILLGAAMGAHPLTFLLHVPAGRLVCLVGVLFDSAGVLWTRRLVAGAAR
jgi:tight adherence protein B